MSIGDAVGGVGRHRWPEAFRAARSALVLVAVTAGVLVAAPPAARAAPCTWDLEALQSPTGMLARNDVVQRADETVAGATLFAPGPRPEPYRWDAYGLATPGLLGNDRAAGGVPEIVAQPRTGTAFLWSGNTGSFSYYGPRGGSFLPDAFSYRLRDGAGRCSSVASVAIPGSRSAIGMADEVVVGLMDWSVGTDAVFRSAQDCGHRRWSGGEPTYVCDLLSNDMNGPARIADVVQGVEVPGVDPPQWVVPSEIGPIVVAADGTFTIALRSSLLSGYLDTHVYFDYVLEGADGLPGYGSVAHPDHPRGVVNVHLWYRNNTTGSGMTGYPYAHQVQDDEYVVAEDGVLTIASPGVLANDPGLWAAWRGGDEPRLGTITAWDDKGGFTYVPKRDATGIDTFDYVYYGGVWSAFGTGTVVVRITPVNDPLVLTLNRGCCNSAQDRDVRRTDEGGLVRVRGAVDGFDESPGSVSVDWGDGVVQRVDWPCTGVDCWLVPGPVWEEACAVRCPTLSFDLVHRYADDAGPGRNPRIRVVASGADDPDSVVTTSPTVTNVAPTVTLAPACRPSATVTCGPRTSQLDVNRGKDVVVVGRVTDRGTDDATMTVAWGDGTTTKVDLRCADGATCPQLARHGACPDDSTLAPDPACGWFRVVHRYPSAAATRTMTVTVTDDDGGTTKVTATTRMR